MSRLHVLFALLAPVIALVIACGDGPTPPKAPSALDVGMAKAVAAPDPPRESADALDHDDLPIPVTNEDPQRGPKDALVTMVIFTDLQCPYCARLAALVPALEEQFGNDLRIVLKHEPLPFHKNAKRAAQLAQMLWQTKGSAAFWKFHDKAFSSQKDMSPGALREWAIDAGATNADVDGDAEGTTWAHRIEQDAALAEKVTTGGTPDTFINGIEISGARPLDTFKEAIQKELDQAKSLESSGTARAKVTAERLVANFRSLKDRKQHDDDDDDAKEDTTTAFKVPIGKSPVRGKSSALVTIVEFADFQCPFCKKVEASLEAVRTKYGDKVRIVWKDEPLPFHPRAEPAAQLARAARAQKGDTAFWDMHDRLFSSQPKLDDADLEGLAKDAGLDVKKAMAAVTSHAAKVAIEGDATLGDDVQANGTPHFFINGRRLVGAVPESKFDTIIDEEIVKAEALVKAGTAATAVYDTLQKDAQAPPEPATKTVKNTGTAPFRGTDKAAVVITEYADFQCPFCSRVEPQLEQVLKEYPGKVKIVWRNVPLPMHKDAALAAEAAREAFTQKGNDGFQKYREQLFKNQQHLERADLESYASAVGLDLTKFNEALDKHTHQKQIDADKDAANAAGITGTPGFTIGPWFVNGAQPYPTFKKLIERTLNGPPPKPPEKPPTTLVIKEITAGTGAGAKDGDTLEVRYVGTFLDGKGFDKSKPGATFTFELGKGNVIKGWDKGMVGMKVGGKRKLTIPYDQAYGEAGRPPTIPPKTALVFEVELIGIK